MLERWRNRNSNNVGDSKPKQPLYSIILAFSRLSKGFPGGSVVKNLAANAGDAGLIPGSGRSPGRGYGNPLQYSCLENPMDRAQGATVHGVTKSWTWLND